MTEREMRTKIDSVLRDLEVQELEERIAPVKCDKNPDAPECAPVARYGVVEDPVVRYGIGF
ncbi:MAG: hypothetical protein ABIJ09_21320 [Pseudomonadota bacterium]